MEVWLMADGEMGEKSAFHRNIATCAPDTPTQESGPLQRNRRLARGVSSGVAALRCRCASMKRRVLSWSGSALGTSAATPPTWESGPLQRNRRLARGVSGVAALLRSAGCCRGPVRRFVQAPLQPGGEGWLRFCYTNRRRSGRSSRGRR